MISAASLAMIALSLERNAAGVLAAMTAGGALGFLRHGFPPASSFMGDTGSNLLGYLLGCIAIQGALKTSAVAALFFPLIVLAVPIFDTGFVVAKRLKYRRPIYEADRWHLHHRMANLGFSQRKTLAYLYAWALIMAGLGLAFRFVPVLRRSRELRPWLDDRDPHLRRPRRRGERLPRGGTRDPQAPRGALAPARDARGAPGAEVDEGVARELETGSFRGARPGDGRIPLHGSGNRRVRRRAAARRDLVRRSPEGGAEPRRF